jgi:branched-chain amino acid aminotransferase
MQERTVYLNGEFLPESQAKVSVLDCGFFIGEGVHDVTRTFRHKFFRLKDHIDRLYRSAKSIRLPLDMPPEEMERISEEVLRRNVDLLEEGDDYWFIHIATRGPTNYRWDPRQTPKPTITMFCTPLPYKGFAKFYLTGAHVVTPPTRQAPSSCYDPKIKLNYRPQIYIASAEAQLVDPEAFALLLDLEGNVTEGDGWNFFIAKDGQLITAGPKAILEGISRQTVIELAGKLGISVVEREFQLYDVYHADEAFMTATSRSILPVSRANGLRIGSGSVPGPITKRLIAAWNEMVGMDIVAQALHYGGVEQTRVVPNYAGVR